MLSAAQNGSFAQFSKAANRQWFYYVQIFFQPIKDRKCPPKRRWKSSVSIKKWISLPVGDALSSPRSVGLPLSAQYAHVIAKRPQTPSAHLSSRSQPLTASQIHPKQTSVTSGTSAMENEMHDNWWKTFDKNKLDCAVCVCVCVYRLVCITQTQY